MPYTPTGTIEVLIYNPQGPPEYHFYWEFELDIAPVLSQLFSTYRGHYDLFSQLFGSKSEDWNGSGEGIPLSPVANKRGLPKNITSLTQDHYNGFHNNQAASWILWWEMKDFDLAEITNRTGKPIRKEMWILFDIMRAYAKWYGDDRVRLVVWWVK